MSKPRYNEAGDTLIEIIFALVIIGLVVSALFSSFATGSTASKGSRDLTKADAALRNAAEATKTAVRSGCINGGTTYSVTFTAPAGFTPPPPITNQPCPPITGAVTPATTQIPTVTLTVTAPNGAHKSLKIAVRSP